MPSVLVSSLNELSRCPLTDEKEKKELYDAALRLAWSVESQQDTAQRLYHGHLPLATAQTGIDLRLFDILCESANDAFTVDQLAAKTNSEPALLARLLGFYAAHQMILQTPQGTFTASNISRNLAQPGTAAGIKHYSLTMTRAYQAIPEFLANNRYENPPSSTVTPFNLAYKTDMPVFEWRKHNPKNAAAGQAFMAAQRMGQRSVWDGQTSSSLQDFELSAEDVELGRVMMCDVGAGLGHQSIELRNRKFCIEQDPSPWEI
ncbi:hypothetical protein LTR09_008942 [Extremus antarcticus]|uniref:O-methyltransferase dimerisation domain-containing protein n=1 Tax=Extremus antarcticus TaxID=702011 RepID=A0AAJ0D9W0_9PEZI|nr:hypothetical protein LTR09_008942 [Extremus antarcticus]